MVDSSTKGKGILASLDTTRVAAQTRALPRLAAGGPALVVGGGVLIGALLCWWVLSGPSPVIVHETLPMPREIAAAPAPAAPDEAAAIVDEAVPAAAPAMAAAPIATVVIRRERPARQRLRPARHEPSVCPPIHAKLPMPVPDGDVTLLTALVAHSSQNSARDVVEPRLADSTEVLLQRCLRVGGEEGRLCQQRICAGRAADDVCRAP